VNHLTAITTCREVNIEEPILYFITSKKCHILEHPTTIGRSVSLVNIFVIHTHDTSETAHLRPVKRISAVVYPRFGINPNISLILHIILLGGQRVRNLSWIFFT